MFVARLVALEDRRSAPGALPRPRYMLPAAAGVLLFLLLNIEIADYYSTGPEILFRFGSSIQQDLTYTIAWLIFGIIMLAAGIIAKAKPARVAAVALIAVTDVQVLPLRPAIARRLVSRRARSSAWRFRSRSCRWRCRSTCSRPKRRAHVMRADRDSRSRWRASPPSR